MKNQNWKTIEAQAKSRIGSAIFGLLALLVTLYAAMPATASPRTEGHKDVLFIRVDFSDKVGEPVTQLAAESLINNTANNSFFENSYGRTTMSVTVTPTYRMPEPSTFYGTDAMDNDKSVQLMTDARAAATAGGFVMSNYELDIIAFTRIMTTYGGLGYVGGKGTWLNGEFNFRVTVHELGHNYGLWHGNLWKTTDNSVIGAGTSDEYGDIFDIMGHNGPNNSNLHFNAAFKNLLDWLPNTGVQTVTTSGIYRINAQDFGTLNGTQALKIRKDDDKNYWIEFRRKLTGNAANGAVIHWHTNGNIDGGSNLLDMTPGTGADDAPLAIGQTFSDTTLATPVHIKPIAKGGTNPEWLDVAVTFGALPTTTLVAPAENSTVSGNTTVRATTNDDAQVQRVDFSRRIATSFSRTPNKALPANTFATHTDTATVSTVGTITNATVSVNLTYGCANIFRVRLFAPDGSFTVLETVDAGQAGCSRSSINKTYDVSTALAGKPMLGNWSLEVSNPTYSSGASGTWHSWGMTMSTPWASIGSDTDGATNGEWTANWDAGSTPLGVYQVRAQAFLNSGDTVEDTNNNVTVEAVPVETPSLVVTTNADDSTNTDGQTSLREAIAYANTDGVDSNITFDASFFSTAKTITLSSALPELTQNVSITGPTAGVTVDGVSDSFDIFVVNTNVTAAFSGLKISNGRHGIVIRSGMVTVTNCTLNGHLDAGASAINIMGGTVTVTHSTLSGNNNGIFRGNNSTANGTVIVNNSTLSGNNNAITTNGVDDYKPVTITNSTLTANQTGIFNGGAAKFGNSILAGNTTDIMWTTCVSQGNNLVGVADGSGFVNGTNGDKVGTAAAPLDARLDTLKNNGGPTQTHELLTGSPAINAGSNALLPVDSLDMDGDNNVTEAIPFDQRGVGYPRVQSSIVDIGAFEAEPPASQPDLLIRPLYSAKAFALNDVYQSTPSGAQIETLYMPGSGGSYTLPYQVKIENDSATARSFVLKASESSEPSWTIIYKIGKVDISAAVRSAEGYTTSAIGSGANQIISLTMTRAANIVGSKTTTINASLTSGGAVLDSVRAIAIVDATPPAGSFTTSATTPVGTTPINNSTVWNKLPTITGVASDIHSGVAKVEVQLYRATATVGVNEYWNGTSWVVPAVGTAAPNAIASLSPTGGGANVTWSVNAGPPAASFADGVYSMRAVITDNVTRRFTTGILKFTKATDATSPTVGFTTASTTPAGTTPANNSTITSAIPSITGIAGDVGSGVSKVELQLYRATSTAGVNEYWNGNTWVVPGGAVAIPNLPATLNPAAGGTNVTWSRNGGLPVGENFTNGIYYLRAFATDKVDKRTASVISRFTKATAASPMPQQSTPSTSEPVTQSSGVKLSSASAQSSGPSIILTFSGALDSSVAQESGRYVVKVGGVAIGVRSAAYNVITKTVTLELPSTSLNAGDQVSVSISGLSDDGGRSIAVQNAEVVAR